MPERWEGLKAGPCLEYSKKQKSPVGCSGATERRCVEDVVGLGVGMAGEEAGSCRALQNSVKTVSF